MMKRLRDVQSNQQGMASFMVTTVLILVIALIIIGFSQVARRNQREALDRQLSTQAFYAAESGVNAAIAVVQQKVASGVTPPPKLTCNSVDPNYPAVRPNGEDVKVTCMTVTTETDSLFYMGVTENTPTVVPLVGANGAVLSRITLTWKPSQLISQTPSQGCNGVGGGLPKRTSWVCGHGILRSDLSPSATGDPNQLAMSTFFNPRASQAPTPQVSYGSRGGLVEGYCAGDGTDPQCTATITGLNANTYFLALRSIYRDSSVTITGQDAGGNAVKFAGQALIDVTAKAQDVLRRVQVRVPLKAQQSSNLPGYAIESSGSVCKRFSVEPGYYASDPAVACN